MANKFDIIVFGATGYTGKFTLVQVHKLAKNLSWGVAGRNEGKLKEILVETAKRVGVKEFDNIPIIIADAKDEESVKKMTAQAKLIINCCGPYDLYGELVVKACIESGTHYVDVTGEIQFVDEMILKYGELAEEKGVYIVNACGLDSIPTDMGICFMRDNFAGTINSVETYIHAYEEGGDTPGPSVNDGTWASIINAVGNIYKMYSIKKKLQKTSLPSLEPRLSMKLPHKVNNGWAIPFPGTDEDIVRRSQLYFFKHNKQRPIQMHHYAVIPSFVHVVVGSVVIFFIGILAQFKFGRNLLLKYPEFFSCGIFTHIPSEEKMDRIRFSVTLKCLGWSDKLPANEYHTPPNKEIIGRVSGTNPGYGFTGLALTLCGLMILMEPKNLPPKGGIYTPAIAFSKTSLVQQLQNNGVVFEILSIKDV